MLQIYLELNPVKCNCIELTDAFVFLNKMFNVSLFNCYSELKIPCWFLWGFNFDAWNFWIEIKSTLQDIFLFINYVYFIRSGVCHLPNIPTILLQRTLPIRYQTGQSLLVLELIRQYSIYTIKNIENVCLKLCTPFSFSKYFPTLMYLFIIQEDGKVVLSLIGFFQSYIN